MIGDGDDNYPEIEYFIDSEYRKFISQYSGGVVGTEVPILYDAESYQAEALLWSNRWTFTLVPCVIGGVLLYLLVFK